MLKFRRKTAFDWITDLEQNYPESKQISAKWLYRGIEAFLFSEQGEKIRKMDEAGKVKRTPIYSRATSFSDQSGHRSRGYGCCTGGDRCLCRYGESSVFN